MVVDKPIPKPGLRTDQYPDSEVWRWRERILLAEGAFTQETLVWRGPSGKPYSVVRRSQEAH